MNWIRKELKKIDHSITDEKTNVIMSIVIDDMVRNGNCTITDYMKATENLHADGMHTHLRSKVSSVLKITYDMVAGL